MFCDTGDTVAHLKFRHAATIHATFFGPHMQKLNMMHEYQVIQRVAVPIYCICGHHGSKFEPQTLLFAVASTIHTARKSLTTCQFKPLQSHQRKFEVFTL